MGLILVEGPGWTSPNTDEPLGRYPLRIEAAVGRIVNQMVPGVITTTRHARMYCLHALGWAVAAERELGADRSAELLRRMEVVMAAIHYLHGDAHAVALSAAHGEDQVQRFLADDVFDVVGASAPRTGLSQEGFGNVYVGPAIRLGLLVEGSPPKPGPRADIAALRAGLGGLVELADRDLLTASDLREASRYCLCNAATSPDGTMLRTVLVEGGPVATNDDRNRQLTIRLLLDALHKSKTSSDLGETFRRELGFGPPRGGDPVDDELALAACLWRAAVLRNYSISAWRQLWRWLALQLRDAPMRVDELGRRLAEQFDDISVAEFVRALPSTTSELGLRPVEAELMAGVEPSPVHCLSVLAVGAKRLEELDQPTLKAFMADDADLGPRWVDRLLREWGDRPLSSLAEEVAAVLVRQAQRVALSKMELRNGRPWAPSRLRDRDGILSIRGEEGAGAVALRTETLRDVLAGLGILEVANGVVSITPQGIALRAHLA